MKKVHFVDCTMMRAHQHAAGAKGAALALVVTEGQVHDSPVFEEIMDKGKVKCPGTGRPRLRPGRLTAN